MVIDMGGGTSDIAVLSLGDIVVSESIRVAGDKMNFDIVNFLKRRHNLIVGERTAETIKIQIGSALQVDEPLTMEVRGRDNFEGMPKTITINSNEVEESLHDTLQQIVRAAHSVLAKLPPELAADIIDRGIMLTGGGALLHGMDQLLSDALEVPVVVAESPLDNVAKGAGALL